jgi:hypothetical protein
MGPKAGYHCYLREIVGSNPLLTLKNAEVTMSTTVLSGTDSYSRGVRRSSRTRHAYVGRFGIGTVGMLTVLIGAWGTLIPFVGPTFGFSADGSNSWHWSFPHALLAVIPGILAVLMGVAILSDTKAMGVGRGRVSLVMGGLTTLIAGAWFIVGPLAWPVLTNNGPYYAGGSPFRILVNQLGYGLGTGAILIFCGAYSLGWASRHQSRIVPTSSTGAITPAIVPTPVDSPAMAQPIMASDLNSFPPQTLPVRTQEVRGAQPSEVSAQQSRVADEVGTQPPAGAPASDPGIERRPI